MSEESPGVNAEESKQSGHALFAGAKGWGVLSGTVWVIIAYLSPSLVLLPLLPAIRDLPMGVNGQQALARIFVELLTAACIAAIISLYRLNLRDIGVGKFTWRFLWEAAKMFPIYFVISGLLINLLANIFPFDLEQKQDLGLSAVQALELPLVFIGLVIITPIVEEVLFRGFLLRAYGRYFGAVLGSILVSTLFAVAHGQVNVGIDVFVLSLLLCYLRIKTGSLWPGILLHSLKNLVAFTVLFIIGGR